MAETLPQNNVSTSNRKELFKALAQFHQNLVQPSKNAQNPFLKNNYVTLEGVQNAVDKACKGTGLSYVQQVFDGSDGKSVITRITHESGESISSGPLTLVPNKKDPQGYGSAITYAKRYRLAAIFGISSELDDDGNQASKVTGQAQQGSQQQNYRYQQRNYRRGGNR